MIVDFLKSAALIPAHAMHHKVTKHITDIQTCMASLRFEIKEHRQFFLNPHNLNKMEQRLKYMAQPSFGFAPSYLSMLYAVHMAWQRAQIASNWASAYFRAEYDTPGGWDDLAGFSFDRSHELPREAHIKIYCPTSPDFTIKMLRLSDEMMDEVVAAHGGILKARQLRPVLMPERTAEIVQFPDRMRKAPSLGHWPD